MIVIKKDKIWEQFILIDVFVMICSIL
jgi:hypothetical protein